MQRERIYNWAYIREDNGQDIDIHNKRIKNDTVNDLTNRICVAYDKNRHKCRYHVTKNLGSIYCVQHQYFYNFSDDDVKKIAEGDDEFDICRSHCLKWHNTKFGGCLECREFAREKDNKRKDDPKRIEYKAKYSKLYSIDYRKRSREKMGEDAYKHIVAENAKEYRNKHPEQMKIIYTKRYKDPHTKYMSYKYRANNKKIDFNISEEECHKLFKSKCYYCCESYLDGGYLLGIDRVFNEKGYSMSNCVAACTMCNMIKCAMDVECMDLKIEHILSMLGIIPTLCNHKDLFYDARPASNIENNYKNKKLEAKKRNLIFKLTLDEFCELKKRPCYLCGKKPSLTHQNGIDRINNSIGYIATNCASCCGSCNHMKKNYVLFDFVLKLYEIYCETNLIEDKLSDKTICSIVANLIKNSLLSYPLYIYKFPQEIYFEQYAFRGTSSIHKKDPRTALEFIEDDVDREEIIEDTPQKLSSKMRIYEHILKK